MMSVLLEQPIPVLVIGVLVVAAMLFALLQTGNRRFLYLAAFAFVVCAGLLVVERMVVTPTEEIELTLNRIARDLESNDSDRILSHLTDGNASVRDHAEHALRLVEIHRVSVKPNLRVSFTDTAQTRATATFNAVVVGSERKGNFRNQTSPSFFVVEFQKQADRWRVASYERHPPTRGMQR